MFNNILNFNKYISNIIDKYSNIYIGTNDFDDKLLYLQKQLINIQKINKINIFCSVAS